MKVGEFAKHTGVSVETVRYYHRENLLPIPESPGAFRHYTTKHVERIAFIQSAKLAGFSLADIKKLNRLDASNDKTTIRQMSEQKMCLLERKIQELETAKKFLAELVDACRRSNDEPCPILQTLSGK
ncbi:MerR family transcriptional regulator [Alteromonas sp. ASW11-36]|uniref:MerR family transcriptional regulator n=1 Tax=Alteromonas arenosi TaxID=3055817 RepID=A0ABT7SUR7_9ALTE|nr:MerR family transcriptional regulator [Alteromonas sp. ASW11-36]MDM7859931.1 MerR family transcriptional regulator [Alteromonas sp. ASW11-36]